jgi:hypothetical protein
MYVYYYLSHLITLIIINWSSLEGSVFTLASDDLLASLPFYHPFRGIIIITHSSFPLLSLSLQLYHYKCT